MKKTKLLLLALSVTLISFAAGCGDKEEKQPEETALETESESEEISPETKETEPPEENTVKELTITVVNMCNAEIGMISVIDPVTGEQINLDALSNGEMISLEAVWPTDIDKFQWAVYNIDGDLYMENETIISTAEKGVTLVLTGDGEIENIEESFE